MEPFANIADGPLAFWRRAHVGWTFYVKAGETEVFLSELFLQLPPAFPSVSGPPPSGGMELAFLSLIHYHTFGGVLVNLHPSCAQLHLSRQAPLMGSTQFQPVSAPEHEVCVWVLSPICILHSPGEVSKHPVLGPPSWRRSQGTAAPRAMPCAAGVERHCMAVSSCLCWDADDLLL